MATMSETKAISWWIFWRFFLVSLIGASLAGIVVAMIAGPIIAMAGGTHEFVHQTSPYVGAFVGGIVQFFALNFFIAFVIGKTVSGKRLMLVDGEKSPEVDNAN